MSYIQSSFISRPSVAQETSSGEDWRPANQQSTDSFASQSGRSDGLDLSSPISDDTFFSRESSPAFEVIDDLDLAAYRKETSWQAQKPSAALSLPPSSDSVSPDDSGIDDMLWDELMEALDTEMTDATSKQVTSNPNVEAKGGEDDEDDELARMTASLEEELAETQSAEHLVTENEAAEFVQKKVHLEEQLRVAAEKAALATRFDHLQDVTETRSKASATRKVVRPTVVAERLGRTDLGVYLGASPERAARKAWREALKKAQASQQNAEVNAEAPAGDLGEQTQSTAGTPMQSTHHKLGRVYHQTDSINWGFLMERMTLSKSHHPHDSYSCILPQNSANCTCYSHET